MSSAQDAAGAPAEVVGLGVVVVDLLAVLEAYPQADTKQDVQTSRIQVGGPVPTALAQLARFGRRCRFIGCWGDDPFGDVIEADLQSIGVLFADSCRRANLVTGHSQVWIDRQTGQRTSVTQRPNADGFALADADCKALRAARIVHLDGWPPALAWEVASVAKKAGAIVVLDTGSPKPGIERLLPLADIVNAPRRFVEEHLGEHDLAAGAATIAGMGPSIVTVTDGEQGAAMYAQGRSLQTAAFKSSQNIDTNGAGDVFCAGLIHGVLSDWPADRMLHWAAATAGLKCQSLGNRSALPDAAAALSAARTLQENL